MPESNPLYTYAVRSPGTLVYGIVHNPIGIPVFGSVADAESDCRMHAGTSRLEHVVVDIGDLVATGIIPKSRLIGKAAENLS